jgi:hypothetical protein
MTLGRHYLNELSKQANVWTGLQAVNRFMGKGVLQRLLPRLSKYQNAGGLKGKAYNTANFLSRPTVGLVGGIGGSTVLGSMATSNNPTLQAIGNNPVLNLGLGALTPAWTALDKIPNAVGNLRMTGDEMQSRLKNDAQQGKDRAINDFISLSTSGQRMFEPNSYLDAVDQGYGDANATLRARQAYSGQQAPREFSTFEKLWKPTDELVQQGIKQKAWELDKEANIKKNLGIQAAKAWKFFRGAPKPKPSTAPKPTSPAPVAPSAPKPTPTPAAPLTAWEKTKTLGGAGLGLGFGGLALYQGAKKLFGTPYDPAQAAAEAEAATQAAIQKRMNSLNAMERFALRMDPSLAVGFMEKELPGSVAKWEQQTGQRYNPGFLAALHDKATGPTKGKMYEFDAQGNKRFYGQ